MRKWVWRVGVPACALVLALVAWRVQRRYFPTCGQVATHLDDLVREVSTDPAERGADRQRCVDEDWSRRFMRELMRADTVKQAQAVFSCVTPEGGLFSPVTMPCTDFYERFAL